MPVSPPDLKISFATSVIATLEARRFDLSQSIVGGGGVMALLGLRNTLDVDVFLSQTYFDELFAAGQMPDGTPIIEKDTIRGRRAFINAAEPETGTLPIDVSAYSQRNKNQWFDSRLMLAWGIECDLGIVNIIAPTELLRDKQQLYGRRKIDTTDANLLRGFLQRSERQPVIGRWAVETARRTV
jgi:hypothetical protein